LIFKTEWWLRYLRGLGMDVKGDKSSYYFLTKASYEMGPKRF